MTTTNTTESGATASRGRPRLMMALLALSMTAALALQRSAIERQSLIGDASHHLLAGHQALAHGTNSLNLEHPPLVKLIAAQPLLAQPPPWHLPVSPDQVRSTAHHLYDDPAVVDHVRRRGRTLLLVFIALPLLAGCALLGGTLAGLPGAVALLMACGLSFSIVPLLSVMQTDAAAALGFVVTALGGIWLLRRPTIPRAALLGFGVGLALASKFSGVLTLPAVAWALIAAPGLTWRRRLGLGLVTLALGLSVVGAVFKVANHRYAPEIGADAIRMFVRNRSANYVGDHLRRWEGTLVGVARFSPGLAQWLTGLLGVRAHGREARYTTYALGRIYSHGRLWYFPLVLLIKTPLVVLAALGLGACAWVRRRGPPRAPQQPIACHPGALLTVLVVPYLVVALSSNFNLGIRHLLPIVPMLFVPAALWVARRPWRIVAFGGLLLLESILLAPLWMSATNTWWLGAANPSRFILGNANLDAHQNLIALREAAEQRQLGRVFVMHPWIDENELHAVFPDAHWLPENATLEPGWYAVAVTLEQIIPALKAGDSRAEFRMASAYRRLLPRWEPQWRTILGGEDHGYLAGSFHLFFLDEGHLNTYVDGSTP